MQKSELNYSQSKFCGQNSSLSRTQSVDSSLMCERVQQYQRLAEIGLQDSFDVRPLTQPLAPKSTCIQIKQSKQKEIMTFENTDNEQEYMQQAIQQRTQSISKSKRQMRIMRIANLSKKQQDEEQQHKSQTQSIHKSHTISNRTKTASICRQDKIQAENFPNIVKISQTKSQCANSQHELSNKFDKKFNNPKFSNFFDDSDFDLGQLSNGNCSFGFSCGFSKKPIEMNFQDIQKAEILLQQQHQIFKDDSLAVKQAQKLLGQGIGIRGKTKQPNQKNVQFENLKRKPKNNAQEVPVALLKQPIEKVIPFFSVGGGNNKIQPNKKLEAKARKLLCFDDEEQQQQQEEQLFKNKSQSQQFENQIKIFTNKKKKQESVNNFKKNQKLTKKLHPTLANQPSLKASSNFAPPYLQQTVEDQFISEPFPAKKYTGKLKNSKNLLNASNKDPDKDLKKNANKNLKKHAYQNPQKAKVKQRKNFQTIKSQIQPLIWQSKGPLVSGNKIINTIKLTDLKNVPINFQFYDPLNYKQFRHFSNSCKVYNCIYCDFQTEGNKVTKQEIIQRVMAKTSTKHQRIPSKILANFYQQICFKLYKYQMYQKVVDRTGTIVNKSLNPSNITRQLYKKAKVHIKQNNYQGYLDCCVKMQRSKTKIPGKIINLVIKEIYYSNAINAFFLKLSDGWSSVWSVLMQASNVLFKYALKGKIKVGIKIQIACWHVLTFNNILNQFLDEQGLERQDCAECIEFFYNNSRILDWNQKLGRPKKSDIPFYRPLNKCKPKQGIIPFVQGIAIRIIANKIIDNKAKQMVYQHFLEILGQNNRTYFIRFELPPQLYLYQTFRINYLYQFTNILYPQAQYLLFIQKKSSSIEVRKQKIQKVNQKLLSRFLNKQTKLPNLRAKNYKPSSQFETCFDFVAVNGKMQHSQQGIINVQPVKEGRLFYQHYKLVLRYNNYYLVKTRFSSIKTTVPKIYNDLQAMGYCD